LVSRSSAHVANQKKKATAMPQWFLCRRIGAFERARNHDARYIRAIIDVDARAMIASRKVQGLSRYCQDVSLAIGLIAVTAQDRSLHPARIDMAERSRGNSANLPAIAAGDG
jgi:hypothetical protein